MNKSESLINKINELLDATQVILVAYDKNGKTSIDKIEEIADKIRDSALNINDINKEETIIGILNQYKDIYTPINLKSLVNNLVEL
jgi:hypothetical protein